MTTEAGIELTKFEESCVRSLQRLARKWNSKPNRLWLFSASSTLWVMMHEGDGNPVPEDTHGGYGEGGMNPDNCVCKIDIENDGGDW